MEDKKKLYIIWAGNREFDLIGRVKGILKEQHPGSNVYIRNADVYSGKADIEPCDGMWIQPLPQYQHIIDHAETAGIKLIDVGELPEVESGDEDPANLPEIPKVEITEVGEAEDKRKPGRPAGSKNKK